MRRSAAAIGEEFPYCVKAAGFADGGAASGRSRPTPPPVGGSLVYAAELLSLGVVLNQVSASRVCRVWGATCNSSLRASHRG